MDMILPVSHVRKKAECRKTLTRFVRAKGKEDGFVTLLNFALDLVRMML